MYLAFVCAPQYEGAGLIGKSPSSGNPGQLAEMPTAVSLKATLTMDDREN